MRSNRTRIGSISALGTLVFGLSGCGGDPPKTNTSAPRPASESELAVAKAALEKAPLGRVVSRDLRGAARFVLGTQSSTTGRIQLSPESATRLHLTRHARLLGVSDAAAKSAVFTGWQSLPGGGGVAQFEQRAGGIEVFRARASVVVDRSNQLVSISNSLPAQDVTAVTKPNAFHFSAEEALTVAYQVTAGIALPADSVRDTGPRGGERRGHLVRTPKGAPRVLEATTKRVLFPEANLLVPAYHIEILARAEGSNVNDARAYVVAADDGRLLYQATLTLNDAFLYRVWADSAGLHAPTDGPMMDITPHPTGVVDRTTSDFIPMNLVPMEGFNKNREGNVDPWLSPTDTVTFGNNVRAYSDRNGAISEAGAMQNNGYQEGVDVRADVTGPNAFDRTFDVKLSPNANNDQIKAAVTQIFYVNNWLHDYWYNSGFDEAAGVAQVSNYNRGGVENDVLLAEAQDGADNGQANNANMSPLSDGSSPRMQMYVWTGPPNRSLEITPAVSLSDNVGSATFGQQIFDVSGPAVLSEDGSTMATTGAGTVTDACQPPTNVFGKIAIVDRGGCNFTVKGENAQAAGALGIILINNVAGNTAATASGASPATTIPLLAISLEDGQKLKQSLAAGALTARLRRGAETQRDGTIDNTIVAHEWGHYMHHRLVMCGAASCNGMSEGWADFIALMMVIREGDTFDGKIYPLAQYAAAGISRDAAYFGIRRAPYSTDLNKNPFTFRHVRQMSTLPSGMALAPTSMDMSEVHNVGEIWAEVLFHAYANLLDAAKAATPPIPFVEVQRRMADYVVAGMKAAPIEPTFTEQRDAILASVYATGRLDDFNALAKGFATRGLGVGAISPPTTSSTLNEAQENFDFKGKLDFVDAKLDDSASSCDADGNLDANETGKLTVRVRNSGWLKLSRTQVNVSSADPNVTFANGGASEIVSIDPYGTATLSIGVSGKPSVTGSVRVPTTITLSDSEAIQPSFDTKYTALVNFDDIQGTSSVDNVESSHEAWTMAHGRQIPVSAWSRDGDGENHYWHGDDLGTESDESLVSPELIVDDTAPFTIAFRHRYSFELGAIIPLPGVRPTTPFDGGVLELSEDGGTTWNDISTYVDPRYSGTIFSTRLLGQPDTNVLAGRRAWTGLSMGHPNFLDVKLDLGTRLAGKTVKVRFRIGADAGSGAPGWDIDDLAFEGITNKPFGSIVDNSGICADGGTHAPDGGADASANPPVVIGPTDTGCSCSLPDRRSPHSAALALVAGGLAMVIRRRRSWRR